MTVLEYERRFTELSHYAPELVPNKEARCEKFRDGLILEVRSRFSCVGISSYAGLTRPVRPRERTWSLGHVGSRIRGIDQISDGQRASDTDGRPPQSSRSQSQGQYRQGQGQQSGTMGSFVQSTRGSAQRSSGVSQLRETRAGGQG